MWDWDWNKTCGMSTLPFWRLRSSLDLLLSCNPLSSRPYQCSSLTVDAFTSFAYRKGTKHRQAVFSLDCLRFDHWSNESLAQENNLVMEDSISPLEAWPTKIANDNQMRCIRQASMSPKFLTVSHSLSSSAGNDAWPRSCSLAVNATQADRLGSVALCKPQFRFNV